MTIDFRVPVLVVDDFQTITRIVHVMLGQIGFKDVDEAPGAPAALEMMGAKKYGLIISDWHMESMTGLDFLKRVRADPNYQRVPFIMVTSEAKTQFVIAAKQAGADGYIVKPFSAETLMAKIAGALQPSHERA